MPQQPEQCQGKAGKSRPLSPPLMMRSEGATSQNHFAKMLGVPALRLLAILAMGTMLAACGRCGDFLPSSQSQIGACHSDPPPQQ